MEELVIIASQNPVKISAVRQAFETIFPERSFRCEGVKAASEVGEQPMSDSKTFRGAFNRAHNAQKAIENAAFWVGIEGGVAEDQQGDMEAFAWVYLITDYGLTGKARTGTFYLPNEVAYLVKQGVELGKADDVVFEQQNSKQQGGSVGILTKGKLDRTEYYRQAVLLALIPILNEKLYRASDG